MNGENPGNADRLTTDVELPLAWYEGVVLPLSEVRIPATDRAFLFGDAVYEVIRIYNGEPWLFDEHLIRLATSLESLAIPSATVVKDVREATRVLIGGINQRAKSRLKDAIIYVQVSRGSAPRRHVPQAGLVPRTLVYLDAFDPAATIAKREKGIVLVSHSDLRWRRCDVKSVNLLGNVMGASEAQRRGAEDVLFVDDDGFVTETSHASFFVVKGKTVYGPPLSPMLLPGITRAFIEKNLPAGISFKAERLKYSERSSWDEAFITGTTTEVIGVVQIDGVKVGAGGVGPVTRAVYEVLLEAVRGPFLKK